MQGRFRYWTPRVALMVVGALSASSGAFAAALQIESGPEKLEIGGSQPGNYLSALIASADRDTPAAEVYYREALRRLRSAYDDDNNSLRFADAYARVLSSQGDVAGARKVYQDFSVNIPHHPLIQRAVADLKANQPLDPIVHNAKEGAAEALYG